MAGQSFICTVRDMEMAQVAGKHASTIINVEQIVELRPLIHRD
jgi:hypothetical protein